MLTEMVFFSALRSSHRRATNSPLGDVADAGVHIALNVPMVVGGGGGTDVGLGIEFVPGSQPAQEGVVVNTGDVQPFGVFHGGGQLLPHLGLGLA